MKHWYRPGNTDHLPITKSSAQRFWKKVDKSGDCWIWTKGKNALGYGEFFVRTKNHGAHRVAYRIAVGPIPDGMLVCHTCDNPSCVNPSHILPGTPQDNCDDAWRRNRKPWPKGTRNGRAKLSEVDVIAIRAAGVDSPVASLCRRYGVSAGLIYQIRRGVIWSHVVPPQAGG